MQVMKDPVRLAGGMLCMLPAIGPCSPGVHALALLASSLVAQPTAVPWEQIHIRSQGAPHQVVHANRTRQLHQRKNTEKHTQSTLTHKAHSHAEYNHAQKTLACEA